MLGDLLSNPLAKTLAGVFAGPLAPIGLDLLSNVTKGGSDPLQSLLGAISDPFKMLFPQVGTRPLPSFPSSPVAFQTPSLGGGTVANMIQSLGDIDARMKSAQEKMLSTDPRKQLEGAEEFQAILRQLEAVSKVSAGLSAAQKGITGNIVT